METLRIVHLGGELLTSLTSICDNLTYMLTLHEQGVYQEMLL